MSEPAPEALARRSFPFPVPDGWFQEFYLGLHGDGGDRKSFREVKHYKRRKRWLS